MTHTAHHPIFALLGHVVARAWRLVKNRRQMTDLASLSDEQLQDIGLTRGDVRRAIALPLGSDPTSYLKELAFAHTSAAYASSFAANSDITPPQMSVVESSRDADIAA